MTFDEFVERHGEKVWKKFVEPLQIDPFVASHIRGNANLLVHTMIENKEISPEDSFELFLKKITAYGW